MRKQNGGGFASELFGRTRCSSAALCTCRIAVGARRHRFWLSHTLGILVAFGGVPPVRRAGKPYARLSTGCTKGDHAVTCRGDSGFVLLGRLGNNHTMLRCLHRSVSKHAYAAGSRPRRSRLPTLHCAMTEHEYVRAIIATSGISSSTNTLTSSSAMILRGSAIRFI